MLIRGNCHCRNISFELATEIPQGEIYPRACSCTFCRMHLAKTWSDPNGNALVVVTDQGALQRYRFALGITEFMICKICGAYVGALISNQKNIWSTLNLRLTDLAHLTAHPVHYGTESARDRLTRRQGHWTPTRMDCRTRHGLAM